MKCSRKSAGKRHGTGGSKIGNVHLKWAFSEAAVSFLSKCGEGRKLIERLRRKHGKANALSILAHKLGRAVYFSEAAIGFLGKSPEGRKLVERLRRKHGKAKALSILAHKLGRAVYYMLTRKRAFDIEKFASC